MGQASTRPRAYSAGRRLRSRLGEHTVTVVVTDNGTPALSDEETFTISVVDWSENWDAYANGQQMHGLNGWTGWEGSAGAGALVSNLQYLSEPNAININGASDLVHPYAGYTRASGYTLPGSTSPRMRLGSPTLS